MKKTVLVSDVSGDPIAENDGASIRITYQDARRGIVELDVTAEETSELASKGRKVQRRGRKPNQSLV
jgi:hypothetical protein